MAYSMVSVVTASIVSEADSLERLERGVELLGAARLVLEDESWGRRLAVARLRASLPGRLLKPRSSPEARHMAVKQALGNVGCYHRFWLLRCDVGCWPSSRVAPSLGKFCREGVVAAKIEPRRHGACLCPHACHGCAEVCWFRV